MLFRSSNGGSHGQVPGAETRAHPSHDAIVKAGCEVECEEMTFGQWPTQELRGYAWVESGNGRGVSEMSAKSCRRNFKTRVKTR